MQARFTAWSLVATGLFITGFAAVSCNQKKNESEMLAKKYCSSCHIFPEPRELDKATWKQKVLPAMGKLMGVAQTGQGPFEESDRIISHQQPTMPAEDWQRIVHYYVSSAPNALPQQSRPPIKTFTELFDIEKQISNTLPSNTFIQIDPINKWVYTASMDSSLAIFDSKLNVLQKISVDGVVVDMFFDDKTTKAGNPSGVLTQIGIMHPNDLKTGAGLLFEITGNAQMLSKKIIDTIPRPVQTIARDLDRDGRVDYLVCGFGNNTGSFFWMRNAGNGRLEQKILRPFPGAIKAYVDDINNDSLPDIISLFAQAREGISLFVNKGNGDFETRDILQFSPVYGSTFFEMIDFNNDGRKDILYTCGDNADYSKILKDYHGVYVFINQGNFRFKKEYFFPQHGAFKALARDFDNDGDLDIAAISYFPDTKNQPEEGFVFLERTSSRLEFASYTIKDFNEGRWLTMDAGDLDQDGDEDIVIGSLYLPQEAQQSKTDLTRRPSFLLLRNKLVKK